jgi:hypothetical protein
MNSCVHYLPIHENIKRKLDGFLHNHKIPHLLFHGSCGTGKKTIVYDFISKIYGNDKSKLKSNVMYVNCAHGKGIKFIRDELKFFAKTNVQSNKGIQFKTIVLFNADSLTIDAQSAMRRCIESFSHNTRFFIIVENKHKLLNPILSRFCEIYVPDNIDENGHILNLHQHHLNTIYGNNKDHYEWFSQLIGNEINKTPFQWVQLTSIIYEKGYSSLDVIQWIKQTPLLEDNQKYEVIMNFHKIKAEYRNEKLLMFTILLYLDTFVLKEKN